MHGREELRKASGVLDFIASLLDNNEGWKTVMSYIPKDLHSDIYLRSDHYERKYNDEHVRLIDEHARRERMSYAKVLFDEWGSSGQVRPTLHTLMVILTKAHMFRAADHLADVLQVPHPPRPSDGPGAEVNVTDYLNNLTSEQGIETRAIANGTDDAVHHGPTMQLEQSAHLMHFPPTQRHDTDSLPLPVLNGQETVMIPNNNLNAQGEPSDLMIFSRGEPSTSQQYMPRFSELVRNSSGQNSLFQSGDSEISESSQSQSDMTSQSETSQSSINQNHMPLRQTHPSFNWFETIDREVLEDRSLVQFRYTELDTITESFRNIAGSGGFGNIFKGNHREHGLLAVKKSHGLPIMQSDLVMKIFNTEVRSLSLLRHPNIVHILGYSLDGPSPCIVCEFIEGGSLLEYMKSRENRQNLNISLRMKIMIGTAKGLNHIHSTEKPMSTMSGSQDMNSSRKQNFVHGDVKSANILITGDFVPKICDLGLSRQCSTTFHTESIMGTRAYMSHERISGTITPKGDTYSFGVVLLELLTGLPPDNIVGSDGNYDIKTYVDEKCRNGEIASLVDQEIGEWPTAQRIYNLAKLCIKHDRNDRPTLMVICDILEAINNVAQ